MSARSKHHPVPDLPPATKGAPAAFHAWSIEELRRRRTRDPSFDPDRYGRAVRIVLGRLGVHISEEAP